MNLTPCAINIRYVQRDRASAKLARHIMIGQLLAQAAATLGISEGHARKRLKWIFRKTDTSGQVELIALLTKLN